MTFDERAHLISWEGVAKRYDGEVPVDALLPTRLNIATGDYVAVSGPSGSGKSTLLNLLGLLDRPSSGAYRLLGVDLGLLDDLERTALRGQAFGFVFQAFHLLAGRTLEENVELGMLYGPLSRAERRARTSAMVDQVGLGHRRTALPTTLSGGERQRVAIARALAPKPRVLLCDEPTGNLDSSNAGQVLDLIDEIHQMGTTVVVVTHDPVVAGRARRIVRVKDGVATSC